MNYIWLGLIIISFIVGAFTGKLQAIDLVPINNAINYKNGL